MHNLSNFVVAFHPNKSICALVGIYYFFSFLLYVSTVIINNFFKRLNERKKFNQILKMCFLHPKLLIIVNAICLFVGQRINAPHIMLQQNII